MIYIMNYIIPALSAIIVIIGLKKKKPLLTFIAFALNIIVWPNVPNDFEEYIYSSLSLILAIIVGYNISRNL